MPASFNFSAKLRNWGFAAPVNPRPVYLVILSADKTEVLWQSAQSMADPRDWQPHTPGDPFYTPIRHVFGASDFSIRGADLRGHNCGAGKKCKLWIGLFMPDMRSDHFDSATVGAAYSVRLANADIEWSLVHKSAKSMQGGVNVLGAISILQSQN